MCRRITVLHSYKCRCCELGVYTCLKRKKEKKKISLLYRKERPPPTLSICHLSSVLLCFCLQICPSLTTNTHIHKCLCPSVRASVNDGNSSGSVTGPAPSTQGSPCPVSDVHRTCCCLASLPVRAFEYGCSHHHSLIQ